MLKDLLIAKELIYDKCGFKSTEPLAEVESAEYGACSFKMNSKHIIYRVAKTTPTKIGQFVTLWKRSKDGPIIPFDISDEVDFFIISTKDEGHFGQFIFPKFVLNQKGIISTNNKGGKRAIRIYPPWSNPISKQAKKTQAWQLEYFIEIVKNKLVDIAQVKRLFDM